MTTPAKYLFAYSSSPSALNSNTSSLQQTTYRLSAPATPAADPVWRMVNIATALPSAPFICTHYCQYPRCRHVHKRICNFTSAKWRIQITQLAFKLLIAAHTDQPGRQGGRAPLYFASPLLPTLTLISAAPGKTEVQYPGSPLPLLTWGRTDDTICNAHLRLLKADMAAVMTAGVSVYSDAAIAAAVVGASHCQLNTPPPGPHAVIVSPLPPSTWPPVP